VDFSWKECKLSYDDPLPKRKFFVLSLFCVFMHVCMAKGAGL